MVLATQAHSVIQFSLHCFLSNWTASSAVKNRAKPLIETKRPAEATSESVIRARLYEHYRSHQNAGDPLEERKQRAPHLRRFIRLHIPADRNTSVLDLGCGSGTLLHFLKEAGYSRVVGVDGSPEQIVQARDCGINEAQHGDVFGFVESARSESYDVVITFDVIEHLTKPELFILADGVYRILSPGGRWIIHVPNAEGIFGSRVRYADLTHEQAFTRESVEQLIRAVGFRFVECFEDEPVIHGMASMIRWLIWKGARALIRIYLMAETGDRGRDAVFSQNLLACAQK
jgi:2-polyprenyl-3-methyl-5-hydroxy-6-metoxy-1,4-benzoquinol methylase